MREFLVSTRMFARGVAHRAWLLLVGVILAGLTGYERIYGDVIAVPPWVAWSVLGLGTFVAAAWAYHDLRVSMPGSGNDLLRVLRVARDDIQRSRVIVNRARDRRHFVDADANLPSQGQAGIRDVLAADTKRGALADQIMDAYNSIDDMRRGIEHGLGQNMPLLTHDEDRFVEIADEAVDSLNRAIAEMEAR